jgi:hypothetical protein
MSIEAKQNFAPAVKNCGVFRYFSFANIRSLDKLRGIVKPEPATKVILAIIMFHVKTTVESYGIKDSEQQITKKELNLRIPFF